MKFASKHSVALRIFMPVLWYGFIFLLTELPYAGGSYTRDTINEVILHKSSDDFEAITIADKINWIFRASAHFFMFGIEAVLLYYLLKQDFLFDIKTYFFVSLILIGILGGLDEFHQSFVPNRLPRISDVMIDCTGALVILFAAIKLKKIHANYRTL